MEDLRQGVGERRELPPARRKVFGEVELAPSVDTVAEVGSRGGEVFGVEVVAADLAQRVERVQLRDLAREGLPSVVLLMLRLLVTPPGFEDAS